MTSKAIGQGPQPLICTPLVGKDKESIVSELAAVLDKKPDVIEWRADFFAGIDNTEAVIDIAQTIKNKTGDVPVIFTVRSTREGGQAIPLSDQQAIELNAAICQNTDIEYVDCELSNKPEQISYLREVAHQHNTKIIASFHNFEYTPDRDFLMRKFAQTEEFELDIAKIAVMPRNFEDVLTLLCATLEAKNKMKQPLITMSMGRYGAITRMVGGVFGSSLTFAVGHTASAPGQVPIDDLRTVLGIIETSMGQ